MMFIPEKPVDTDVIFLLEQVQLTDDIYYK